MAEPIEERLPISDAPETGVALEAFQTYLEMGPTRSFNKLLRALGKSDSYRRQIERWSSQYSWQARCRAYDLSTLEETVQDEKEKRHSEITKRKEERLSIARVLRQKAVRYLNNHDIDPKPIIDANTGEKRWSPPADVGTLNTLIRILDYADRTERLDLGEATERTEVSSTPSISDMSDEELVKAVEATLSRVRTEKGEADEE